jgi:hypothetical protein
VKLLFSIILGCLAVAGAPPGIRVRVLNLAHIPGRTLTAAENSVAEIFRAAGVPVTWVDCDSPGACSGEAGTKEFWLQLLNKRPTKLSENVLGFALLTQESRNDGSYAAVAWEAVRSLVDCLKIDPVPVLSAAMAHELGHLMLGPRSHSREGVMVARFGQKELALAACGSLRFTDAQVKAIRRFAATSSP